MKKIKSLSIKKFATLTGLDKETIRFYRNKGLLHPKRNEENGYTFYDGYDFMDLYSILKYRDMEMPIHEINELMHGENLDLYERKLKEQVRDLEEELVRIRRKLFRIKNASMYLANVRKQNKFIMYQEDGMALYTLWLRKHSPENLSDLLTKIPGSYIGINIPLSELREGPLGEFYSSCIGVGISEPSVSEYDYSDLENMEYTTAGPVLKYYVRLEDPLNIKKEDMQELLNYAKENGYEFIDHTTGYLCGMERENGKRYYYFLIRVRVKKMV